MTESTHIPQESLEESAYTAPQEAQELPQDVPSQDYHELYALQAQYAQNMQAQNDQLQNQYSDLSAKLQNLQNQLMPPEQKAFDNTLEVLKNQLGLGRIDELQKNLQDMQAKAAQAEAQAGWQALSTKYPTLTQQALAQELLALQKQNPQLAASLDNPQGWEMIYLARMANTQPKADMHIANQAEPSQPDFEKLKGGNMSLEDIGKMF